MTRENPAPGAAAPSASSERTTRATRALLACGVVAGPVFVVVALVQVLSRDGFDLRRHPLSLLSLGDLGWIQITNFVVTGALVVAFAVGMRRVLHPGRGGTWGPLLVGAYGVGLTTAGFFVADASLGFPPGAPEGIPDHLSWHGILHGVGAGLAFPSLIVACFVFVRRFAALRQWGWVAYCVVTGAAVLGIMSWPDQDTVSLQLAVASILTWAWTSAVAARLMTEFPDVTRSNR